MSEEGDFLCFPQVGGGGEDWELWDFGDFWEDWEVGEFLGGLRGRRGKEVEGERWRGGGMFRDVSAERGPG